MPEEELPALDSDKKYLYDLYFYDLKALKREPRSKFGFFIKTGE